MSDAAELLGVTERFVRRLVAERRIPFYKVGKFVRFKWLCAMKRGVV